MYTNIPFICLFLCIYFAYFFLCICFCILLLFSVTHNMPPCVREYLCYFVYLYKNICVVIGVFIAVILIIVTVFLIPIMKITVHTNIPFICVSIFFIRLSCEYEYSIYLCICFLHKIILCKSIFHFFVYLFFA